MNIVFDAMGGDFSPIEQVRGCVKAARELDCDITIVGDKDAIEKELEAIGGVHDRIKVVGTQDVISNDEEPAIAVRKKKNSSIVVAAQLVADGEGDALISTGSTGATLAAGIFIIGRMKGVKRPCLAPVLPTMKEPVLLADCGANADCKPEYLVQFASMASIYMKDVLGRNNPRVALANIGSEPHKGNELAKKAYELLSELPINFVGNVEGRDLLEGDVDVIVTDGFTGNMILKLTEGLSHQLMGKIKGIMMGSLKNKLAAAVLKKDMYKLKKQMDYQSYGGALLLGCKAPVIKCHGSSKKESVFCAVEQAKKCVESKMLDKIQESILLEKDDKKEQGN